MADRTGQQFGNYRLVALVGQGGYAEVYLGQHVRLDLQAAIKVLHTHLTGSEAQTIARLTHPAIVRVFDFDVQDGVPFLVMDYAPNGSLRKRYPKGSLVPLPQLISSVKQIAPALQYAHDQKFMHRDVKSASSSTSRTIHATSSLAPSCLGGRHRHPQEPWRAGMTSPRLSKTMAMTPTIPPCSCATRSRPRAWEVLTSTHKSGK